MKSLLLLSLLAFAAAGFLEVTPEATLWTNCNQTLIAFKVETFTLAPWPPKTNENVAMNVTGTFTSAETLDALVINVDYQKVPFYQVVLPRTGSFAKGVTYSDGYTAFFPTIAPPGSYSVALQLRNSANAYLNCLLVSFTL